MTRKKYERDTYDDGWSTDDSSSSEEEELVLSEDEIYDILENMWGNWQGTSFDRWNDVSDLFEYFYLKSPVCEIYHHTHLLLSHEKEMYRSLCIDVCAVCKKLGFDDTSKMSQVVYDILNKRNKFCIIHRDDTHWTRAWCKTLRSF